MTLYMFRQMQVEPPLHELSKWSNDLAENRDVPSDVYRLQRNYCDCPAHVPHCKHLALQKRFRDAGIPLSGLVYDDTKDTYTRFICTEGYYDG